MIKYIFLFLFFSNIRSSESKKEKEKGKVIPQDLPLIECDVCQHVIAQIYDKTQELKTEAGKKKLEEILISEAIDKICANDEQMGQWIRHMDITKVSSGLTGLKLMDNPSKCQNECVTIEKSCSNLILSGDEIDRDDLSAILWKGKLSQSELQDKFCKKITKRCPTKNTKATQNASRNRVDYPFVEISAKDLEMENLMAQMKASGMGGMSMYNREDMDEMAMNGYGPSDGDDMYGGDSGMSSPGGMEF